MALLFGRIEGADLEMSRLISVGVGRATGETLGEGPQRGGDERGGVREECHRCVRCVRRVDFLSHDGAAGID